MKYYSDNSNLVTLKFADSDTDANILSEDIENKKVEEIFEKYYLNFFENLLNNNKSQSNGEIYTNCNIASPEEHLKKAENDNILQDCPSKSIENDSLARQQSINLFFQETKNKLIYSCYYCESERDTQTEYEKHCVLLHPNKSAYPSLPDIKRNGLKPQGKPWE